MTLHDFNTLPRERLVEELTKCCSSSAWIDKMLNFIPAEDLVELLEDADECWWACSEKDWKEAFAGHPRIGDRDIDINKSAGWASNEQAGVKGASEDTLQALVHANEEYEKKFGYIFIVCATGKSAEEMLGMLNIRLQNNPEVEIEIAAEEQSRITKLRIEKLLES